MTTIAANRECMAADQRVVTSGAFHHEDKIFRVGTSLFGTAGHGSLVLVMLEWLKSPARNRLQLYKMIPEDHRDEIILLELNPGGLYRWDGWGVGCKVNDPFHAVGSGSVAALQKMRDGASPKDAVHAAMQLDECSGPPIQVEYLKQKRKR